MTTKKEMARLIEQMAATPEATQWLRERNEAMRRSLREGFEASGDRGADPHQRKSDSRQAAAAL